MRQSHSRCPPEKWTSLSSVSGPTGTRRRRSSSCSSASSSRTQEAAARCPGPLHRPWCLHLPRVPPPFSSTIFRHFFRHTKLFKSKYWKQQKPIPQNRGNVPRNRDPTSSELKVNVPV